MQDLMRLMPDLMDRVGDNPKIMESLVYAAWKGTAGEGLKDRTVPLSLDGGRLLVAVEDEIWKKHLEALAGQLIYKINSFLRREAVTFIDFTVDEKTVSAARGVAGPVDGRDALEEMRAEITDDLRSAAEAIRDGQLRENFLLAAGAMIARRKRMAG